MIPEYDEKLKPDEFLNSLVCVENIFAHKPMTDGHKITLVATQFRNYAAIWWAKLQRKRRNQQIDPVDTWTEMKNLLKQKFLPVNYSRDLRLSFQYLKQGSKTVVEYSEEFITMQSRCGLDEEEDVLVDRYFNGLTLDIQDILAFKHFDNVDEIVQHAIKAEGIANHQARKLNASKWLVQKNSSIAGSKPSDSLEKVFAKPEGQNRITCINCKQQGHRATECPKRIHLIENESDVKDAPDDDPKENDI